MSNRNFAFLHYPAGKSFLCLGQIDAFSGDSVLNWNELDAFIAQHKNKFIVSLLGYDLKNSIENLSSHNRDEMEAPDWVYFVPESVYQIENDNFELVYGTENNTMVQKLLFAPISQNERFELQPTINKSAYIQQVKLAQKQIQLGNCYELNFCHNFEVQHLHNLDTWSMFRHLHANTQAPFAAYLFWEGRAMIGASPERFIKKEGQHLLSQPIKGTRPRKSNIDEDLAMKEELRNDIKERAENVMIVDLVRNDLTRVAKTGSIHVDELFGIYSFNAVHQMISTISCELKKDVLYSEIIRALFPMGSMTGAPKISAMKNIEQLENFKRGWYSGSIGLMHPNGDFDMNVVIRSLLYNENKGYLSCPVGSAITILSDPEAEYEECMMKINRILALFA